MARPRLIDPVAEAGGEQEMEGSGAPLSIESLSPAQVKPSQAKAGDPFSNYDFKAKTIPLLDVNGNPPVDRAGKPVLVDGKAPMVCLTHIVLHNHIADPVVQDPINRESGRVNYHSTSRRDEFKRQGIACVFDRPYKTAKGIFYGCVVPQHNVRAQLIFRRNSDGRVEVDNRYLLLDPDQVRRLREVFSQVINPKVKQEKQASFISGETNVDPGEIPGSEE